MIHNTHIVARSSNSKIGPIATSYRSQETCPTDCRFLPANDGGCYATGRINGMAKKYSSSWSMAQIYNKIKGAPLFRDRVVGDVMNGDEVDYEYLRVIGVAAKAADVPVFSYTHAWANMDRSRIPDNYVMNASTESVSEATRAISLGFPTVITNDDVREGEMIAGKRVVTCPAQTRDNVTCATCKLCSKPQRKALVRFLVHGIARNKARTAIEKAGQ